MAAPTLEHQIRAQLERRAVGVTDAQLAQLGAYVGLITKWNATVNLTALQLTPLSTEAIDRLLVEPLLAAPALPSDLPAVEGPVLIDIGSGGGSPAIPLKIAKPEFRLTMIESKARKSAFLRDAVRQLGLSDAQVVTDRLENLVETELGPGQPVENRPVPLCGKLEASAVSVRAVRADRALWDAIEVLLRPGGVVLWFRSEASGSGPGADSGFELVDTRLLIAEFGSELAVLRKRS